MEHPCYRCGDPVEDAIPFCPACGAPQIRVASRESKPLDESDEATLIPPPPPTASQVAAPAFVYPGHVQWRPFLRIAIGLAPIVGFAALSLFPLGCILLAGSVVWAIQRYSRSQPGPLQRLQAAKLGALVGLLSFGFSAIFLGIAVGIDPSGYRHEIERKIHETLANNPRPEAQAVQSLFSGTEGIVLLTIVALVLLLILMLIVSATTGALSANLSRSKPRP